MHENNYDGASQLQINQSSNITIDNCVNIDVAQLEEIHSHIVFYDTIKNTYASVNEVMNDVGSDTIHQCGWINDRILGNCSSHNTNYGYRDLLNDLICDSDRPCRDAQLCTQ